MRASCDFRRQSGDRGSAPRRLQSAPLMLGKTGYLTVDKSIARVGETVL